MTRNWSLAIALFAILFLPPFSHAGQYKYRIAGNRITLFGKTLKATIPLRQSKPEREDDSLVDFYPSPNHEHVLVCVQTWHQSEFFLYSKKQDMVAPLRFDHGREPQVRWLNIRVIAVTWGGNGYTMTRIVNLKDPNQSRTLDDVAKFVEKYNYYVTTTDDGIEVGCIEACNHKPEVFTIKHADGTPIDTSVFSTDVWSMHTKAHSVVIDIREPTGKTTERVFRPDFLQS